VYILPLSTALFSGLGALGISVEGAHRSDLEMKSNNPSEYTLQYKPHEPGIYLLNVKFGDDHVNGKQESLVFLLGKCIADVRSN
jgi:hypothetical protein